MMKLVIRGVAVWGHPNIRTWEPDDPSVIAEVIQIDIGPRNETSADTFTLRVATPAGLDTLDSKDGILAIRPLLVMNKYDFDDLWRWLEATVKQCEGDTWQHCIEKLRRFFDWEYDGLA